MTGCPEGDVRLLDGNSPLEGRVEVCNNNEWNSICESGWNNPDAKVVCRELGLADVGKCSNT